MIHSGSVLAESTHEAQSPLMKGCDEFAPRQEEIQIHSLGVNSFLFHLSDSNLQITI